MSILIKFTQRAMDSFESLPTEIQEKAHRAINLLQEGKEREIHSSVLKGGRKLYSGRIDNKFRIIYSKKNKEIFIVDFIKIDGISKIMRSEA
ncbi:hypothetical protein VXS03_15525 [Photobacterium sp. S4TG1]|uniref:type II toxin-antitoxin system RelE family toxin n=1 Tax=Photobacterium sp. S4TG1 TaxID=3114587 RepID=UPI002E182BBC|nr:hypothetical protein [Photobacterium sp. S4TG1]